MKKFYIRYYHFYIVRNETGLDGFLINDDRVKKYDKEETDLFIFDKDFYFEEALDDEEER